MEINAQDVTILDHFTARSGARTLDLQKVVRKRLFFKFVLDEHQADLYRIYFMGGTSGGLSATVRPMVSPLRIVNMLITYKNELQTIWTYSHTTVTARPSAPMNFSDFERFVQYSIDVEALTDLMVPADSDGVQPILGKFVFTTFP
jgi:hypothetical protein